MRIALPLIAAVALTHLVDYGAFDLRYQLFNASTQESLVGVLIVVALGIAAAAALRVRRFALGSMLVVLLALRLTHMPHVLLYALPFTLAAFVLMWREGGRLRAACVLLLAAYAVHGPGELVVDRLGIGWDTWVYQVKVVAKHGFELAGWTLAAVALLAERRPRRSLASRLSAPEVDQDPGLQELPGTG